MTPFDHELAAWGWDPEWARTWSELGLPGEPARVVAVDRGSLLLQAAGGLGRGIVGHGACEDRLPTVGDWCAVGVEREGLLWRVHGHLPRRSSLVRRAAGRATLAQDLAANVDYVFLMCGLDTDQGLRSLERLLAIVLEGGAEPVVVLNKIDLHPDVGDALDCARGVAAGFSVLAVSGLEGSGLGSLSPFLGLGRTIALLGPSGSGKSTLVNTLVSGAGGGAPVRAPAATAPVRPADRRGRHTTTRRQLHRIEGSALLLDTPGLRELGAWSEPEGLRRTFADVHALAASCRFRDCRHEGDPGCMVRAALLSGGLTPERFHRFIELYSEAETLSDRRSNRARLEAKRRSKQLSKNIRHFYRFRDDER